MRSEPTALAERCRRIARSIGDAETAAKLVELAYEYERRAGREMASPPDERNQRHWHDGWADVAVWALWKWSASLQGIEIRGPAITKAEAFSKPSDRPGAGAEYFMWVDDVKVEVSQLVGASVRLV